MRVKGWSNGSGTYGIRVGAPNRRNFFDENWASIEVEIEGVSHRFVLSDSFWGECDEFRGRIIREWLRRHRTLKWPNGSPPSMELIPLGENRFRLDS